MCRIDPSASNLAPAHALATCLSCDSDICLCCFFVVLRKYKDKIRKNPDFRGDFQRMCQHIGVDPLACAFVCESGCKCGCR